MIDITEKKAVEAALIQAQARQLEAEAERSRSQERERLLRDIHDGFGSQLASARLMAERGDLSAQALAGLLQDCMADLNLVIDTLGKNSASLIDALADFRFRTDQRLRSNGPRLHWVVDLDEAPRLSPRVSLQLLRIVQEALSNALRHAGAANIWISVRYQLPDGLHLQVVDDGCGLPASPRAGRGLSGMRSRAREIGARLLIEAVPGGSRIDLIWNPNEG